MFQSEILLPGERILAHIADVGKSPRNEVLNDARVSFAPSHCEEATRTRWSLRLTFDSCRRKLCRPDALLTRWGDRLKERSRRRQRKLKYWRSKQILYGEKWVITSGRINFLNRRVYRLACRFAPHDLYEPGLLECAVRIGEGYLKQKQLQRQQEKESGPIWADTSNPNKLLHRVIQRVYAYSPGANGCSGDWKEPEYEQALLLLHNLNHTIWRERQPLNHPVPLDSAR